MTFDKHYYGYVTDKIPTLALTTAHKNYLKMHHIPFREIEDVERNRHDFQLRERLGLPHPWDEEYAEQNPSHLTAISNALSSIQRRVL
jgi:hypothetical protein